MKSVHLMMISTLTLIAATGGGCERAVSNVQTMISDDCGQNWKQIPVGGAVPARVGTCALKITVPNYPMAGESNFRGTFKNRVRVNINASYDYTIVDPKKFIQEARFLGRQNSAGDDDSKAAAVWDTAENIVIDRRLRDLANSNDFLLSQDVVDFNQGEFEDQLQAKMNEILAARGVRLNTLTFVVTPDDQTRNMIDVAAALRVCGSIEGMTGESCQAIIKARASAPNVTVNANSGSKDNTN